MHELKEHDFIRYGIIEVAGMDIKYSSNYAAEMRKRTGEEQARYNVCQVSARICYYAAR